MKNIDCEVYIKQLITFFENNPNDLIDLIGDVQKDKFYEMLREQCEKNSETGDHVITKDQMINIVIELKMPELNQKLNPKKEIESFIQKTKWGDIILN